MITREILARLPGIEIPARLALGGLRFQHGLKLANIIVKSALREDGWRGGRGAEFSSRLTRLTFKLRLKTFIESFPKTTFTLYRYNFDQLQSCYGLKAFHNKLILSNTGKKV